MILCTIWHEKLNGTVMVYHSFIFKVKSLVERLFYSLGNHGFLNLESYFIQKHYNILSIKFIGVSACKKSF